MTQSNCLSGELNFINLGDLLQLLGTIGGTGVLTLTTGQIPHPGTIYLKDGDPVDAVCGKKTGQTALFDFFGWIEGRFDFKPADFDRPQTIEQNRMGLILDGLRLVDEGKVPLVGHDTTIKESGAVSKQKAGGLPLLRGGVIPYGEVVDEEFVPAGQSIMEEGHHDKWMYAILDGTVKVVKNTENGPLTVMRLGSGSFIGYVSHFMSGRPRSASVVAENDVTLGVLNPDPFNIELFERSKAFGALLRSLAGKLSDLTQMMVTVAEGKKSSIGMAGLKSIGNQNNYRKQLFRVTHGSGARVVSINRTGFPMEALAPGDFVGHIPFGGGRSLAAQDFIFGSSDFKLELLNHENLQKEFDSASIALRQYIEHLIAAIGATDQQLKQRIALMNGKSKKPPP